MAIERDQSTEFLRGDEDVAMLTERRSSGQRTHGLISCHALVFSGLGNCSTVALQDLFQRRSPNWLWQEEIHARVHAFFNIAFLCKCGEGDNWS